MKLWKWIKRLFKKKPKQTVITYGEVNAYIKEHRPDIMKKVIKIRNQSVIDEAAGRKRELKRKHKKKLQKQARKKNRK